MSDNNKAVATAQPKPALKAQGGAPRAIVPADIDQAYRLATLVVRSGMAPKAFDTAEKATVAIMHGLEVGLTPMAALQSIAVVNGMPTIWGDGMLALIQGSGLLEDIEETSEVNEKGEWQYSICRMKRRDRPTVTTRQFTRVMAAKAGLLGKQGPWSQYPDRMGQMRARSWCARDAFPDVLRGLHNTEETMDMVDITNEATATTTAPEPRRSDFTPKPAANQAAAEPEEGQDEQRADPVTWPAYDYTGDQLPEEYPAVQWVEMFTEAMQKAKDPKIRQGLLVANHDTAREIWESDELSQEQADGLAAFWKTTGEAEGDAPKDWSLPENVVGQEAKLAGIYKMLEERTETTGDVEDLYEAHEAFLAKLTGLKKSEASKRFSDRKILLGQRQAAE